MLANLREDARRLAAGSRRGAPWYVVEGLLFDNGFQAVVFYRAARWFKSRKIPLFGPLLSRLGLFFTGVEISASADIGPGLKISHGTGMVIGGYAKVGARAHFLHGTTLGSPSGRRVHEMPVLGDGVFLGAGSAVIGAVRIGDGAKIAAGCLVTEDVPAGARVRSTARIEIVPAESEPRADAEPGTEPSTS